MTEQSAWEAARDSLRFDTYLGLHFRPYTTDVNELFRCQYCDVMLGPRKARYCTVHRKRHNRNRHWSML